MLDFMTGYRLELLKNKECVKVTTGMSHVILANNSVIKTDLDVLIFEDQEYPMYAFIFSISSSIHTVCPLSLHITESYAWFIEMRLLGAKDQVLNMNISTEILLAYCEQMQKECNRWPMYRPSHAFIPNAVLQLHSSNLGLICLYQTQYRSKIVVLLTN